MKTLGSLLVIALVALLPASAWSTDDKSSAEIAKTDVVPSGTYSGTAHRVDPKEKEIYVKTDDGKMLELYLDEKTKLTSNGKAVKFDALKKGQKVEVEVKKQGDKLQPVSVQIKGSGDKS